MPKVKTIKVVARAGRIISDRHALQAGARRFIGRGHFASLTLSAAERQVLPPLVDRHVAIPPRTLPFVEHRYHADYVLKMRDGDLLPFDEVTAKLCGVPFQPELLKESEVVDEDTGMPRVAVAGEKGDLEAYEAVQKSPQAMADAGHEPPDAAHEGDHQ